MRDERKQPGSHFGEAQQGDKSQRPHFITAAGGKKKKTDSYNKKRSFFLENRHLKFSTCKVNGECTNGFLNEVMCKRVSIGNPILFFLLFDFLNKKKSSMKLRGKD